MSKNITSNTSQLKQAVCSSCKEAITSNQSGSSVNSTETPLCNKCKNAKKKRRNVIVVATLVGISLVTVTGWWYLSSEAGQRSALGFGDIGSIQDSVKIEVKDSEKMSFNIASTAITSVPISAQSPISNIDDFHRVVAESTEMAKSSGNNVLSVPTTALLFQLGSNELSLSSASMIQGLAKVFKETNQKATIIVEGFACNLGEQKVNDYISKQRANAVKAALTAEGIDSNKIEVRWYGKSRNKEFQLSNIADYRRVLISFQ